MDASQKEKYLLFLKCFQEEAKNRSEGYNITARKSISLPLFVNAGASTALVNFFIKDSSSPLITAAALLFMLGAIFGILILTFEFFAAYFSYSRFNKTVSAVSLSTSPEVQFEELALHYKNISSEMKKWANVVLFEVVCGILSIILGFLGIYCISVYIIGNFCFPSIAIVIFAFISIASIYWIKHNFDSV